MTRLGPYAIEVIGESLVGLDGAARHLTIMDLAERLGCSKAHIYRKWRRLSSSDRAPRKDRGKRQTAIAPDVLDFMYGLSGEDFAGDHVVFITARHFGLRGDFISRGAYNAWLRQERINRRLLGHDIRPYRSFESPRANHMHHYDTTVAEAFYPNDDGSIGREEKHQRYKNKPGNKRPRLVLYGLIDDHSRVIFARFYFSENTLNLLDFVFRAWSEKEDRRFPFCGIPEHFYCDLGSPAKSAKFKHAEKVLGFKMVDTTPSHATEFGSRKHGKVERIFGEGLLGEFMKITKIFKFAALDELNTCLWEWLIHLNNRKHSTTGEVRFARWMASAGTPRLMPGEEMFKLLHYDRAMPTVSGNLQFRLNGKVFQLPYRKPFINWVGAKVEVYWYPGHEEKISVVYDNHEEEISSLAPVIDIALEYKKIETTEREKLVEKLKAQNYSAVNFPAIYTPEKDLPYLPRKGEAFDESKIAEKTIVGADLRVRPSFAPMRYLTKFEAVRDLRDAGVIVNSPISPAEKAYLDSLFEGKEKISEEDLRSEISSVKSRMEGERAEGEG